MAPRKRKPVAKRRSNRVLRDGDEMEEHGLQQNEQEPDLEVSQQPIQKQAMAPSTRTRSATASRNARSVIQEKLQAMENSQPQIFAQASMGKVMGSRTRKASGNQSGYCGLEGMDQMEGDGQLQSEEELEFQMNRQINGRQVTAPRSQRSTVNKRLNHGYLEQDEMEEHELQEDERYTNLEVTDALRNALQILMASGSRRPTTNQTSDSGFQDNHQRQENGQWKNRRKMRPPISQQASIMTHTTRKATGNHLGYHILRDEIPMEGDGQHQNEEQPDFQMTRQVIAPSTRRTITNLYSRSGFCDKNQTKENGQPQIRKQLEPQTSHQASMMASRTRKAITNQSGYYRLRDEDQMERDRQHGNEEQPEFQTTRQMMTRSTRRSTAGGRVNHGLLDEDEIEEDAQRENGHVSDMEVTRAIENALKILMPPSTRRETTNENSHCGFQDMHQIKESRQQQSRQPQTQVSQQASISAVMSPRSQDATRNQSRYHRLRDDDQMEGDEEQQNEEPPEIQMAQPANDKRGLVVIMPTNDSAGTRVDSKDKQSTRSRKGKVCLIGVAKRMAKGVKHVVEFNCRGQPCGKVATEMQSYIGVVARQEVKISYKCWKMVPQEVKDTIWEYVSSAYEVNDTWKSGCLESANSKWRQWKSKLYRGYIVPNKDNSAKLNEPPPSSGILREDWNQFVRNTMSEEFKKLSEEQAKRAMKNMYPHRLSRSGYAGLAEKMKEELCGDDDVDRAIMWKKARVPKNGDIENENLKKTVQRIDDYIRQKEEGEFKTQRSGEDLLTCALESGEHSGRVRAVGSYVTPSMFFKHGRKRRQHMENEQLVDLMEAKKHIVEQNEMICHLHDRLSKLEAAIAKDKDDEVKGSHDKQPSHLMDEDFEEEEEEEEEEEDEVVLVEKFDALQNKRVRHQVIKERKVKCYDSLHPSLKVLCIHAENSLSNEQGTIFISFDEDIFGKPFEGFILCEDIIPFCELEQISGNCIVVYMWHLYKKLKENSALDRFRFVDPFDVSYVSKPPHDAQTRALADRFENVSSNQLVIVPVNVGVHWILTVIDPHKETISIFDPLGHWVCDESWQNIVNKAISMFNARLERRGKKQPTWEIIKSPRQPDSKRCGFFIMCYMKEIIEELTKSGSICLHSHFDNRVYTQEDIDKVRVEWANVVLNHI
ncbi:uncharacterized protein LOC131020066 isoform X3 [Salvia miltiorrhiza]|uniref:uncharacterized protein LOC131020066 isoform X3 n=1 Tax=Salvia miltiorrhiza TaxID=226208 RepID=UPI0025ABC46F|nr:uncharacterized protein LOC131020066 isoform X3 [Salvia miltiorrhiza]XP_057804699.1 uncharacterized protein LOC131020066 isoform X3 [Salvia miltiorrhiza]